MKKSILFIILSFLIGGCSVNNTQTKIEEPTVKITDYNVCDSDNQKCIRSNLVSDRNEDVYCNIDYLVVAYSGEIWIIFSGPKYYADIDEPHYVDNGFEGEAGLLIKKDFPSGPYKISILSEESGEILTSATFKVE